LYVERNVKLYSLLDLELVLDLDLERAVFLQIHVYVCLCVCADVRQQLSDQLRCLDARLDGHVSLLAELHDFYRRRSEVELEYSRNMDKLVRQVTSRHKTERLR